MQLFFNIKIQRDVMYNINIYNIDISSFVQGCWVLRTIITKYHFHLCLSISWFDYTI